MGRCAEHWVVRVRFVSDLIFTGLLQPRGVSVMGSGELVMKQEWTWRCSPWCCTAVCVGFLLGVQGGATQQAAQVMREGPRGSRHHLH